MVQPPHCGRVEGGVRERQGSHGEAEAFRDQGADCRRDQAHGRPRARRIWATTSNGTVRLHGTVHSFYEKKLAEDAAKAAPGVAKVENDIVVGVVSIGDLVKAVIDDQQHQLDQLQRYIAG